MTTKRRRMTPLAMVLLVVVAAAGLFATTGAAFAHPLGNFTINRYARIETYQDAIRVHYVVDLAEIPAFQATEEIDTDKDGVSSEAELTAYAERTATANLENMALALDRKAVALKPLVSKAQLLPGQGGLQVLRIDIVYGAPLTAGSKSTVVTFEDGNYSDRVGWKEIVVLPSAGTTAEVAPGLLVEQSKQLAEYPTETLKSAPDMRTATFSFVPGTGSPSPTDVPNVGTIAREASKGGFASLINKDTSSAWVIFLSLLAAFGFGMIHALGPGHGKTVVAAYLVGSKGTVRHAVALGATVTATHTSTVYIVGFISLAASSQFATEKVQLYIGVAAGLMIIAMGLSLFLGRLWRAYKPKADDGYHKHGFFGKAHSHMPGAHEHPQASRDRGNGTPAMAKPPMVLQAERAGVVTMPRSWAMAAHAHEHGSVHVHSHGEHGHQHGRGDEHDHGAVGDADARHASVTWKSLVTLGIAGGMLPCPSAIVVMISAIALGKVLFGMLLIVAFSLGLAGVLTAIGIGLVLGKRISKGSRLGQMANRPGFARVAAALPIVSAAAVTIAGVGVTLIAVNQAQIL